MADTSTATRTAADCPAHKLAPDPLAPDEPCMHDRCRDTATWRIGHLRFCRTHAHIRMCHTSYRRAVAARDVDALEVAITDIYRGAS